MNQLQNNALRLLPLLLVIFVDSFSFFIVIPVLLKLFYNNSYGLLPVATSLATRNILTGVAVALSTFMALLSAPLMGSWSDRFGRKKILLLCLALVSIGFILPIIGITVKSVLLILLGRAITGIGSVSQPVAQACVADFSAGKRKALFLSLIALMMTLPIILGPLAGSYLSDNHLFSGFSVKTPYYAALIISAFNILLVATLFKETLSTSHLQKEMPGVIETFLGLKKMARRYHIGLLFFLFFSLEFAWSLYYQSAAFYLKEDFHYSVKQISLFNTYMGIFMSAGLLFVYPLLIRYFSLGKTIAISFMLVLFGMLGCSFFQNTLATWFFVIFITLFSGTGYTSLLTMISNRVSQSQQGWVMGYASALLFLAWVITGFASGWLVSLYSALPIYLATFVLGISAIAFLKYLLPQTKISDATTS